MRHSRQAVTIKEMRSKAARADTLIANLKTKTPAEIFTYIDSKIANTDLRKIIKALFLLTLEDK